MAQDDDDIKADLESPDFVRFLAQMENDAETAIRGGKSLLSSPAIKALPPAQISELKSDTQDCDNAHSQFMIAYNALYAGKGDPNKLRSAFNVFELKLAALQIKNVYFQNLKDAKLAEFAEDTLRLVNKTVSPMVDLADKLDDQLDQLRSKLLQASKTIKNAKLQAQLNVTVSLLSLALPEMKLLRSVLVSLTAIEVHLVIDKMLGPSGLSVSGVINTTLGDSGDIFTYHMKLGEALSKSFKQYLGVASLVTTLQDDTKGYLAAKKQLDDIRQRFDFVTKMYAAIGDKSADIKKSLPSLRKALKDASDAIYDARSKSRDAAEDYKGLKKLIQKL